jgi:hypothetical protein
LNAVARPLGRAADRGFHGKSSGGAVSSTNAKSKTNARKASVTTPATAAQPETPGGEAARPDITRGR